MDWGGEIGKGMYATDIIIPAAINNKPALPPIAILKFNHVSQKHAFEGDMKRFKNSKHTVLRNNRPDLKLNPGMLPSDETIKQEILGYMEQMLEAQGLEQLTLTAEGKQLAMSQMKIFKKGGEGNSGFGINS